MWPQLLPWTSRLTVLVALVTQSMRSQYLPTKERGEISRCVGRLFIAYLFSQDTCVFQSTNAPWGLSRQAQTCSSNNPGKA
jgi:hypothetical protein